MTQTSCNSGPVCDQDINNTLSFDMLGVRGSLDHWKLGDNFPGSTTVRASVWLVQLWQLVSFYLTLGCPYILE